MQVIPVRTRLQLKRFCQFQLLTPPVAPSVLFNPLFNPVMNHLHWQGFLALEKEQIVGRIAAVRDQLNPRPSEGFFSGLEVLKKPLAAQKLLQAAAEHLQKKGCRLMLGPATWNLNQEVGLVIEGNSNPGQPGLPGHPAYYPQLLEQAGLQKLTDLLSFHWYRNSGFPELTARIARRASRNPQVKLQKFNFYRLNEASHFIQKTYNHCLAQNWGFIPFTLEESLSFCRFLARFGDPDLQLQVLVNSQPAGLLLCTPFPAPRKTVRIAVLGIMPEFRLRGLEALLLEKLFQTMEQKNYQEADISQIHEDNHAMLSLLGKLLPVQADRRFRVYQQKLE